MWESLSDATCCRSLVVVYESSCVLQIGFAADSSPGDGEAVSVDVNKLMQGSVYQGVMKSGARKFRTICVIYHNCCFTQIQYFSWSEDVPWYLLKLLDFFCACSESYLANLSLYPGKSELPFLPLNTQVLCFYVLNLSS